MPHYAETVVLPSRASFFFLLICGSASLVRGALADGLLGAAEDWNRYESPHFELISQASDADSREMLRRLELFHAVFANVVRVREQRSTPVTIYFFGSEKNFRAYTPGSMRGRNRLVGFYLNGADSSVIVVSPLGSEEGAQRVIYHEYIHHLAKVNGDDPPLWYTEGLAELFSTIFEDGNFLSIGLPIQEHVAYLRANPLMPLEMLFAIDRRSSVYHESNRVGLFYAQSWALLHYWYCGTVAATPANQAARDRFFAMIRMDGEQGDPTKREALFTESMGMGYAETVQALENYVRNGRYTWTKIKAPDIAPMNSYSVSSMPHVEIKRRLADLDSRVKRTP